MVRSIVGLIVVACGLVGSARPGTAQPSSDTPAGVPQSAGASLPLPPGYNGPAAPQPPHVITRSDDGRQATIRAVRVNTPIRIDGRLDEEIYQTIPSISDFIQQEPREGAPATEKTEVWLLFNEHSLYVVARCWDSQPDRMIGTEMRRDGIRIPRNENLAFALDTFFDHRNGYNFEQTPVGGMMDAQIYNDGVTVDLSWNGVEEHGAARFGQGWATEMRIPFKTLRYRAGAGQVWAFQVRRMVRWKNELAYITRLPQSIGERAHMRLSLAPVVVGLEVPPPARNLDIKPWVTSSVATDKTVTPQILNDRAANWGVDAKYGVTKSLTADLTYKTDFAQVEADLQQVNLTRFNLNFPERREFFLENSGAFTFAGSVGADNTPALFYSRRIGLSGSQAVPIIAGARLSGRAGRYQMGLLNITSDSVERSNIPVTNFSVVRIRRDVLRRSTIGVIATARSANFAQTGANGAYGFDTALNLKTNLTVNGYFSQTLDPGPRSQNTSYKGTVEYAGDRYGALAEYLSVDPNFNPEVGFVRRRDMRRSYAQFRFSPRPANRRSRIRKYYYSGNAEHVTSTAGQVQNKTYAAEFAADFQNSDRAYVRYLDFYEYLPVPVILSPTLRVPVGAYDYRSVQVGYNFGPQRFWFTTNTALEHGTFYGGHKTSAVVTTGAISWPPHLIVEPAYTLTAIKIPQGEFNQHLLGPRITYGFTPLAFVSALVQHNSATHTVSSNVRLRWEYQPGSELFVVWNEQHDTFAPGLPVQNRALIIKFNRLFRL